MTELPRRTLLKTLAAGTAGSALGLPVAATEAPTGGATAHWTTGEQYGLCTVRDHHAEDPSRVWATLTEGALNGVRFPRIDVLNVRSVDVLVADPAAGYAARTFDADRTTPDTLERTTEPSAEMALLFEQTIRETASDREWELTIEYAAHPDHDAIVADIDFTSHDGTAYDVYLLVDPALSNSGGSDRAAVVESSDTAGRGTAAGRSDDTAYALTARDTEANDSSAVLLDEAGDPIDVAMGVASAQGFHRATADVVGGDVFTALASEGTLSQTHENASGNVILLGQLAGGVESLGDTVALGFATQGDERGALTEATQALATEYAAIRRRYASSWQEYVRSLDVPDAVAEDQHLRRQFNFAAMALKAADAKQVPGAGLASLCVPWGGAVDATQPADFGYNFVWARDLYQSATAMAAVGDVESATDALAYIYEYQQREDGFIPQNTYVDGRTRWGGEQLDAISFPQVMARQLKKEHGVDYAAVPYGYENVRASADYVVANGPATGQERWEEESGYSPSTIAAEIAGLVCAADLATDEGRRGDALVYYAFADEWQANLETWLATTTGTPRRNDPDADYPKLAAEAYETPYYFRINDDRDPDDGATLSINNGGPTLDERSVIDAGFLELVRLGITPWDDPVVENSLEVVDETIRAETPHGPAWYRYTGDGYGEQADNPDDDHPAGGPWPLDSAGRGRLWPIFTAERAEYELLAGTSAGPLAPANLLETMAGFANSGLMIPEQVWDETDPTQYDWAIGEGTGSATPLSWSMAAFVRLAHSIDAGRPIERPGVVERRYADGKRTGGPSLAVDFPPKRIDSPAVTVAGTTDGADVVVKTNAETVTRVVDDGSFSVDVAVDSGESVITVVASDGTTAPAVAETTTAQKRVSRLQLGETVATFDDSTGDDHGPGSYVYPTGDAFRDGVFDIDTFEIYETDDTYQFLTTLAGPLTNPWGGNELSVQSLQFYVRHPGASGGTTAARAGVNASFEAPYHRRVFVEGFVQPRVEAADGATVTEDVAVTGFQTIDAILVEVPRSALGDLSGAQFVPLVLGQDGFSYGSVRPVAATATDGVFGGGAGSGTRDSTNPNVIDLITPEGVTQAQALAYDASSNAEIPYIQL